MKPAFPLPKPGSIIEITQRNCTSKQYLYFTIGSKFVVKSATVKDDGSLQIVVSHPKRAKATLTFNTKKIGFKEFVMKDLREEAFKKQVADDVQERLHKFTLKEHYQISFVPLIITEIAFVYAEKVHKYCAEHRIWEVKKLGRAVKFVRQDYISTLRKDLTCSDINRLEAQTKEFMDEYATDFFIMWVQASNIISNKFGEIEHPNMRIDALIGREFCKFFNEYNRRMNALIAERMGGAQEIRYPYQEKLMTCLDAYLGDADAIKRADFSQFDMCFGVIRNRLMNCDFSVTD